MKIRSLPIRLAVFTVFPAVVSAAAFLSAGETGTDRLPENHAQGAKHLFIDRRAVETLDGVEQVFHQPIKEKGPVVAPDRPWEDVRLQLWSAPAWSAERSCWQMWYYGGEELLLLYAESPDGLKWHKPRLGLVDWKGTKDNNRVDLGFKTGSPKENRIVLIRDERETDPARRYKGLTRIGSRLVALVSADGLAWKRLETATLPSDDEYRLSYDALSRRFVATMKRSGEPGGYAAGSRPLSAFGRRVALSTSQDLVHWSEPELILWGDERDQQIGRKRIEETINDPDRRRPLAVDRDQFFTDIYNMPLFTYGDMYLGLPVVFHHSGVNAHSTGSAQDGILYPTLAASRDLLQWDRLSREPFIPLSRLSDEPNYDQGMISATRPVPHGDELWFYYTGARFTHMKRAVIEEAKLRKSADEPMGAVFLARLRVDGFASLRGGPQPGTVLTVPVKVTGPRLYVNVDAKAGELRTEIRDVENRGAMAGRAMGENSAQDAALPVRENATRVAIEWRAGEDLSKWLGQEVRLCFSLKNADLYAFWFGD